MLIEIAFDKLLMDVDKRLIDKIRSAYIASFAFVDADGLVVVVAAVVGFVEGCKGQLGKWKKLQVELLAQ